MTFKRFRVDEVVHISHLAFRGAPGAHGMYTDGGFRVMGLIECRIHPPLKEAAITMQSQPVKAGQAPGKEVMQLI